MRVEIERTYKVDGERYDGRPICEPTEDGECPDAGDDVWVSSHSETDEFYACIRIQNPGTGSESIVMPVSQARKVHKALGCAIREATQ